MDIRDFNPFVPPMTDLKAELQESQKSFPVQFIEQFDFLDKEPTLDELWENYSDWIDNTGLDRKFMGKHGMAFAKSIKSYVENRVTSRGNKSVRLYRAKSHTPPPPPKFDSPEDEFYAENPPKYSEPPREPPASYAAEFIKQYDWKELTNPHNAENLNALWLKYSRWVTEKGYDRALMGKNGVFAEAIAPHVNELIVSRDGEEVTLYWPKTGRKEELPPPRKRRGEGISFANPKKEDKPK
jgi:hypothetical protein